MEALPEETTDQVKNSSLYSEFMAEREEILRHKWIESEKQASILGLSVPWWTGLLSTAPLGASSVKPFGKRDLFERSWADSQLARLKLFKSTKLFSVRLATLSQK